jgi:class 3 adenylate cyclase
MSETAHVRYVFLDIVGFTRKRTVEAQSDIVGKMNNIVRAAIDTIKEAADETILLPTGDGIAVAILNSKSWDIHLRLALEILRDIADYNASTDDHMRRFNVRIGINENVDNVVLDINEKRNVAGYGISMAQRIMDKADANQILIGRATYEILNPREKYAGAFKGYQATAKHGTSFPVYQLVLHSPGLDTAVPAAFVQKEVQPTKLTAFAAYYIAHAAKNRAFFLSRNNDEAAITLLSFLAEDSVTKAHTPAHEVPITITWNAGKRTFEDQYNYYREMDIWVLGRAEELVKEHYLLPYESLFTGEIYDRNFAFVLPAALKKLRIEYPAIAKEFGLSEDTPK